MAIDKSVFFHTITFSGLQVDANNISSFTEKTPRNRPCLIQQVSDQPGAVDDNVLEDQFNCFLDEQGSATINDKAVDNLGREFRVIGINNQDYTPNSHCQMILVGKE